MSDLATFNAAVASAAAVGGYVAVAPSNVVLFDTDNDTDAQFYQTFETAPEWLETGLNEAALAGLCS